METVTLQQDAHDKLKVTLPKDAIISAAKKLFKWRKADMAKVNKLGTVNYDKLIEYLFRNYQK